MDQVKAFARAAAKHVFWIGCGLILAGSMATWYLARKSLHDEFTKNQSDIKAKYTAVSGLQKKQNPPNEKSHAEMDKLLNQTLNLVLEAWKYQYSRQETILRWPLDLREDFVTAVRPLKPIEAKVDFPTPPAQELKVDFRRRYAGYVGNLLPRLADVVETKWLVGRAASGMGAMMGVNPAATPQDARKLAPEKPPIVIWDPADQTRLVATHFDWSKQPDQSPTTLQILYAQEDLWVLTALMFIIRETNDKAEARHEAVVKTIETILIGRQAPPRSGQVIRLAPGGMGGMMPGGMADMGGGSAMYGGAAAAASTEAGAMAASPTAGAPAGMPTAPGAGMSDMGMSGMGMPGMGTVSLDPAEGRYVDNQYQALKAQTLRDALRANTAADAFLVVAKRMPVRMRLVVDERKLPRLLAKFGNAMLPVEVRQVRINRARDAGGGGSYDVNMGGGGYPGMMGGSPEMGSGMGMSPGYPGMMGMGAAPGMGMGLSPEAGMGMGYGQSPGMVGPDYSTPGMGAGLGMPGQEGKLAERTSVSPTSAHDVPVEIYGIIYIYNPVDEKKLGLDQQPGLTGTAPAAATPPS